MVTPMLTVAADRGLVERQLAPGRGIDGRLLGRARLRGGVHGRHGRPPSPRGNPPCARMAWSTTANE